MRPEVVIARRLRREMTLPEVLLWQRLKGAKSGPKFGRQHPIGPYVADFFQSDVRLIVEIEGQVHDGARANRDRVRQLFFEQNGYQVARVLAAEILRDPDAVVTSIAAFAARPLHQPSAGPPPRSGEDQE
jgi:very-short-patch-repair endonuclease